jgi:uncharacterized protein (DUF305 family)
LRALLTALGLAVGLALGLAACGGDDGASDGDRPSAVETAANGDVYNEADVEFASNMIPHHAQAIQMVTFTDVRTLDPEVKQLADSIRAAQSPEVETMVGWLTAWGEEIPETSMDHVNAGHDLSEMSEMEGVDDVPGMMSAEEMEALMSAPDGDFQDRWLQMMKEHHEGAIEMAETERDEGTYVDAIAMAESIVASQQAEIDQIEDLLGS